MKSLRPGKKKAGEEAEEKPKIEAPKFEQKLKIVGVADDNGLIADYLTELKACELFSSVEVEFIKETRINKVTLRKFEMVAELRRNADVSLLAAAEPATLMVAPMAPMIAGEAPLDEGPVTDGDTETPDEAATDIATVDPEEG